MSDSHRAHSRVEELGVAELVSELLARPGMTYEAIAAEVQKQTGEAIGKSSIARYNEGFKRRMEKVRAMRESADAMAKIVRESGSGGDGDGPDMVLEDLLLNMMGTALLERVGEDEMDTKELTFLAAAGAKIASAKTGIERLRQTERKRVARAYAKLCDDLRGVLESADDGALWKRVEEILAGGADALTGGAT